MSASAKTEPATAAGLRRRAVLATGALVAVGATLVAAGDAAATSALVDTEAEYRSALTTLSADSSGPHTITLEGPITVTGGSDPLYVGTQPLTIDGNGFELSGGGTRRVLNGSFPNPALTLTDIVVTNGFATTFGGAVAWYGPVTVTDSTFDQNVVDSATSASGGAISADTSFTATNSIFSGSTAEAANGNANGGAVIVNGVGATATITDSVFRGNEATSTNGAANGGAVRVIATIDVDDSAFPGNAATGTDYASGGALSASTVNLDQVTMSGNQVLGGNSLNNGGAVFASTLADISDSTLRGNEVAGTGTTDDGGAVASYGAVVLNDTTIADNIADRGAVDSATLTATHATVAGNTGSPANLRTSGTTNLGAVAIGDPVGGADCAVGTVMAAYSVDSDGSCELAGPGNQSSAGDLRLGPARPNGGPMFGPVNDQFSSWTRFPLAGSPVIDRLPSGLCTDTLDQRGVTRPFDAACEAGAIEAVYPPHAFTDVAPWVEDAVRWLNSDVNDPPLMVGITPTTFEVPSPILRGQVVRLLYREAGEPDPSAYPPHPFTDVPAWVEDAVRWASGEDIVTGETATTFVPYDPITRAQVVRMVYRFAGSPDVTGLPAHPFTDVPAWVEEAVTWAANTDNPLPLITGITPTTFEPADDITRGQVARLAWRLGLTPEAWDDPGAAPSTQPFRPVPEF